MNRRVRYAAAAIRCTWVAILAASATRALAESLPVRGVVDPRVRVVHYSSDEVYRLHGFIGYEIDLQFETGESFVGLGAGDIEGLSFVAQDNHLFIKPKAGSVTTNLTILTNRRAYQIDYVSSMRHPDIADADAIYALRFSYPPSSPGPDAGAIERALERAKGARAVNIDYWYCGSPAVKPVAVSDDGVHTRLRFGARSEQPAIFIRNEDGSESLLNFSIEGADVVVHRVVRKLIVRRGRLIGEIFNKKFDGEGERLESGTLSPALQRATPGIDP